LLPLSAYLYGFWHFKLGGVMAYAKPKRNKGTQPNQKSVPTAGVPVGNANSLMLSGMIALVGVLFCLSYLLYQWNDTFKGHIDRVWENNLWRIHYLALVMFLSSALGTLAWVTRKGGTRSKGEARMPGAQIALVGGLIMAYSRWWDSNVVIVVGFVVFLIGLYLYYSLQKDPLGIRS
jgi:hypothetical protein